VRGTTAAIACSILLAGCAARCPCETPGLPPFPALAAEPPAAPSATQVFLDAEVIRVSGAGPERVAGRVLSDSERHDLVGAHRRRQDARVLTSPKVLVLDGQDATIFLGEDADAPGGVPDPVDRLDRPGASGFVLRATPRVSGGTVSIGLVAAWKERGAPAGGRATRLEADTVLADGSSLLLEGPLDASDPNAPGRLLVVVTARILRAVAAR
jgi:hypothetical protein